MARHFAQGSSQKIVCSRGGLGFAPGALTVAAIVQILETGASPPLDVVAAGTATTGTARWSFPAVQVTTNMLGLKRGSSSVDAPTIACAEADGWQLIAACVAAGTSTPRFHRYKMNERVWTHENGASTLADGTTPATSCYLGCRFGGATAFFNGDIAIVGVWNAVLTDAQIEALVGLRGWWQIQPKGLWVLDQAAVAQKVRDDTGLGANQSSIVGTTVAASSPSFTYGVQPLFVRHPVASGTTYTDSGAGSETLSGTSGESETGTDARSGSLTLTGSASEVWGHVDSGSGTLSLSGTSAEVWGHVDAASGTLSLSGTATDDWSVSGTTYTDAMAGGLTLSGSRTESQTATAAQVGSLVLTGSASEEQAGATARSGGLSLSGSASEETSHSIAAAGAMTLSGSGVELYFIGYTDAASGTLTLSGSGTEARECGDSAAGALVLSGVASDSREYADAAAGALALSGSSPRYVAPPVQMMSRTLRTVARRAR